MVKETAIKLFEHQQIRAEWDDAMQRWYFAIVDVIAVLTGSQNPQVYWRVLKKRLLAEGNETVTNCNAFKMTAPDGKKRLTDVADTEQLLRMIQSIPSPKAEPFKQWLAQVGYERIREIENPELAQERMKQLYEQKGYPKEWIDKRLRGIAIRQNLTDEWQERGISTERDFSILTAEIAKATFGVTPSEHKDFKGLTRNSDNLRDHMTDLELIFTMLGERVTTEISQAEKPDTFTKNRSVARRGGGVAGTARKETEKELGRSIVSKENFLPKRVKGES
ncbi:MAG: Bro-N domain-containing protein [Geobacter sp.]|nr:Bro-N domain-containing protein [Geobacter sp.]